MQTTLRSLDTMFSMAKKRWKVLLVLLLLIGGVALWYVRSQANKEPELTFVTPIRQDIVESLDVSGTVDAKQKARLRFLAGGKITYVGAQEGSWVKRGQTLASIDQATLQKQLELQLNAYTRQRNSFENYQDSIKDVPLTTTQERAKDDTQLKLEDSVLSVEQQALAIQNTSLYAPFEGLLTVSPVTVAGVQVTSTEYFEIIQPTSLIFKAAVDEADIAQVTPDLPAVLILDAYPDKKITTKVQYIAYTSSESSTGTVFVVEFPLGDIPESNLLRLGMNGNIAIELKRANNALTIPLDATKERDGKTYVMVQAPDGSVKEREIVTGITTTTNLIEVISGLSESDRVQLPE